MAATATKLPSLRAKFAFAGRKLYAWWEGYAFDEAAERAALQTQFPGGDARPAEQIVAEAIWGEGRLEPGAPVWTMRLARMLSLPVRANVIVFGAGAGAPLEDLKHGTRWQVTGLTRAKHVAGGALRSYDMAMQRLHKTGAAGALSFFELHRDASPAAFAGLAADLLLPGAKAVFVDFAVARRGARLRSCFPSARHGAPKTEAEYIDALRGAGFSVSDTGDETGAFMQLVAQGWSGWRSAYAGIANLENAPMRAELTRAMAQHAHLWAERFDAMKSGQLRVPCIRATRN